jgi:phage terminase large subunit-like protein
LLITPVPGEDLLRGEGGEVDEFIESYCRVTKESWGGSAGTLLRMRPWQVDISSYTFARRPDGRLRHREALIGLPRKNGKSALGSSFGLYGLIASTEGAEVYSCAADKDQARIVFNVAKRPERHDPGLP